MNLPLKYPEAEPIAVLVADDDEEMRAAIASRLRQAGHRVAELADGRQLFELLLGDRPAFPAPRVVVADMFLPGMSGLKVCSFAHDTGLSVQFVLTTEAPSDELRDEARRAGATFVFDKPVELALLGDAVSSMLEEHVE